jgi:hypothetical protein
MLIIRYLDIKRPEVSECLTLVPNYYKQKMKDINAVFKISIKVS